MNIRFNQKKRIIFRVVTLLSLMFLFVSCSSSRILNYPYSKVSDLAKKEFYQNSWTKNGTKTAELEEWNGGCEIKSYDWEFPNIKIYCEIEVVKKSQNRSKLYVYVKDCNSWWYPFRYNPSMATELLDAFEKQLKWYKFTHMEKPWTKLNKE